MSTARATATHPAPRRDVRTDLRPQLHVVEGRRPRRVTWPLILVVLAVVVVGIVGPMVLNTRMAETSFAIRDQQIQLNQLEAESWTLQMQIQQAESPVVLEQRAREVGLVPAGQTGMINLSTGAVTPGVPAR